MGLFSKLLNSTASKATFTPQTEQDAWIAVMYGCMSVDGDVSQVEIDRLLNLVVFKSHFEGHPIVEYYKRAMVFQKQSGSQALIDNAVSHVAEENKPTVFALIMELLLSDGILGDKEKEIIEYLSAAFMLEESLASRIVEVMMIKNKDNIIILG